MFTMGVYWQRCLCIAYTIRLMVVGWVIMGSSLIAWRQHPVVGKIECLYVLNRSECVALEVFS
jgi:hypothetical protein